MRSRKLLVLIASFVLLSWQLASWTISGARAQTASPDNIVDFEFQPAVFSVPAGATVIWTNLGPTPHDVASTDMSWSSNILMTGDTYSFAFSTPGTYQIYCTLHPTMLGTITVSAS